MKSEMPDKLRMSSNEKKASLLVRLRFLFDHARIQMEKGNISILSKVRTHDIHADRNVHAERSSI